MIGCHVGARTTSPSLQEVRAFATFCNDEFVPGALALASSLRSHGNTAPLVVMHLGDLSSTSESALSAVAGVQLRKVTPVENPHQKADPRFSLVFSKLQVFSLFEFDKVVFLDADALVLGNLDALLDEVADFAAAPDHGIGLRKGEFNSGVFVCRPNAAVHADLLSKVTSLGSRDGGDQGFLNEYFRGTARYIGREFNTLKRLWWHFPQLCDLEKVRVLHFVGAKPWHQPPQDQIRYQPLYDLWWAAYPLESHPIPRCVPTLDEQDLIRRSNTGRKIRGVFLRPFRFLWGKR